MAGGTSDERKSFLYRAFLSDPWPVFILALTVLYFAPVLMAGETLFFRDLYSTFIPQKEFFRESVLAGQLPFINSSLHGGQPFLANVATSTLYPGNVIFLVLPFVFAFNLLIAGHFFMGAVSSYFLGRELKMSKGAALATAFVFSFCGVSLSQINLLNQFLAFSWMPLQLLLWHRCLNSAWKTPFVALVFVSVAQFMAGGPEVSVIAFATLLIWMCACESPGGQRFAGLWRWLALLALVIGISAVQILPTAELLSGSSRGTGLGTRAAMVWSLHPLRLAELALPGVFGAVHTLRDADYWGRGLVDSGFPYLISVYFGWPVLLFAAFGAARGEDGPRLSGRLRAALAIAAAGGFILALGRYLPGFSLLYEHVPGASIFRFPSKFALASVLPMAILAGCGVDRFSSASRGRQGCTRQPRRWVLAAWFAWVVMACSTLALLMSPPIRSALIEAVFQQPADSFAMEGVLHSLAHSCGALMGCCLLLTAISWGKRGWIAWCAAALVLTDLGIAGIHLNPSQPPQLLREPPPAAQLALREIDSGRLFSDVLPSGVVINAPANDVVWRYRFNLEVLESELGANFGLPVILHEDLARMAPLELMEFRQLLLSLPWERRVPLLSAAGVSLVLSSSRVVHPQLEFIGTVPNRGDVPRFLYRNLALPLPVHVVTNVQKALAEDETMVLISSTDFDPRTAVVLHVYQENGRGTGADVSSLSPGAICEPRLTIEADSPTLLRIGLHSPCATVVCFNRTFTPGWRVRIDGEEVPLERANLAFMAVQVPSGKHLVELHYRPRSLLVGLLISLLTLAALCAGAVSFGRQVPAESRGPDTG